MIDITTFTLHSLLPTLISQWENEVIEFKNAGDSYATSDIGKYFSALSNEANLRDMEKIRLVSNSEESLCR